MTADYDASTVQAFAEIGYRLHFGAAWIEPFAQIARIWVDSERLGERGGAAALEVARAKMSTSVSTLGARLDQSFSLGSLNASLQLSAGWRTPLVTAFR
ncbi:autotransporter outer membrane beta-barrel domain-containing protein [Sphingopyxis witflariensis]|uniref:autotransporter outer membrane beta-barrel domain-containing protein n=1 Tax=Sphingopyxis witflariensis TaxID=173675 RepID=UPI002351326E|nr:autotransporter outer membrane beta-barrel domain-containing protein [Sphingopyxis witflariensis]